MKVYAVKHVCPYEFDYVLEIHFNKDDAKNSIIEEVNNDYNSERFEKRENTNFNEFGFYDQYDNGWYIEEFTVQGEKKLK